jgi:hypothetical protein
VKQWLDSEEIVNQFCCENTSSKAREDIHQSILAGSSVYMLRQWMEVSMLYMRYITYSDKRPLGKVKKIWWRHEYQDTMGNLSHIHSLIWLEKEPLSVTQDRIQGSLATLIRSDEIDTLIEQGLAADEQEIAFILDEASRILKHKCSTQCKKRKSDD